MSHEEIIAKIKAFEEEDDLKISQTIPYTEFAIPGLVKVLTKCYTSSNPVVQKVGSVLNAAFYHQRPNFIITRMMCSEIVENDPNLDYKSLNWRTYNKVMAKLKEWGLIKELRSPTKGRAGLYGWDSPTLVSYMKSTMGETTYNAKDEQGIENYDKSNKTKSESVKTDPEVDAMLAEIKKERKGSNGTN